MKIKSIVKIDEEYGRLKVVGEPYYKELKSGKVRVVDCECKCGSKKAVMCKSLTNNNTKSCGCYHKEILQKNFRKGTLTSDGIKKCSMCGESKSDKEYGPSLRTKDKLMSLCIRCQKNKEFLKKYGITFDDYEVLYNRQNGKCAICEKAGDVHYKTKKIKYLCVDHEHSTDRIRGLLCHRCNAAIGRFGDSINLLNRAIKYLETWSTPFPAVLSMVSDRN